MLEMTNPDDVDELAALRAARENVRGSLNLGGHAGRS
jgi:hypothetical protein